MEECPFCNNNRRLFLTANGYNVDEMYFFENEDFSISADMSPLVIGHILAITKKHFTCYGAIDDYSMIQKIKLVSESLLGTDDLLFFEHGAVVEGKGGASVDHAHMHIMPRPANMSINTIDKHVKESGFVQASLMRASFSTLHDLFLINQPYIFFSINNSEYTYIVDRIPHQFIRMIFQPYCNLNYNWRETYNTSESRNVVRQTVEFIKSRSLLI